MPNVEMYRASLRLEFSNMRARFLRYADLATLTVWLPPLDALIERFDALTPEQYELYETLHDDDVDNHGLYAHAHALRYDDDFWMDVLSKRLDLAEALS